MVAFTFDERAASRGGSSYPPNESREYVAAGSNDAAFVRAYAFQATPPSVSSMQGTLYRQDIRLDSQGHQLFYVSVPYGPLPKTELTLKASTTGGTFHIQCSKENVGRYMASGQPDRNHKGAIGVQPDFSVDGADIVIPALKLTCSYKHPAAVVSIPYIKAIARLTGKVNSAPFLTFSAGEVLFLGFDVVTAIGATTETVADYHFACEENLQNKVIAGITVGQKLGHDLLWAEFGKAVDATTPVVTPLRIHIERVYDRLDLAAALGFGG